MSGLSDHTLDGGLSSLVSEADTVMLCPSDPASYAAATSASLGTATGTRGALFAAVADQSTGRSTTFLGISGTFSADGDAKYCVIADSTNSRILFSEPISVVTQARNGTAFSVGSFDIGLGYTLTNRPLPVVPLWVGAAALGTPVVVRKVNFTATTLASGAAALGTPALTSGGGSTFDTTATWPDATNRPTISGSTLSWIGPTAGGASTTTDVAQSHALTAYTGTYNSTANNQVIEYLDISDGVVITHSGVTLRRCRVRGGSYAAIACNHATGPTIIEDCLLDGTGGVRLEGVSQDPDFTPKYVTVRRCNLQNYENHFAAAFLNCVSIDNYYHMAGGTGEDADMCECSCPTSNMLIQHNTFDGRDTLPFNTGAWLNSGVKTTNDFTGGISNVQIVNNRFIHIGWNGGGTPICNDDSHGGGTVTLSVTNNGFYDCEGYLRHVTPVPSPNTGNFDMATVDATSGSLVAGTGAVHD